VQIRPIPTI